MCSVLNPFSLFQLSPCEVQQAGTWLLMVQRTVANQAYEVKTYWESMLLMVLLLTISLEATILDGDLVSKNVYTIASPKKTIYFTFSGPWLSGFQTLTAVVDNVVGGEVSFQSICS